MNKHFGLVFVTVFAVSLILSYTVYSADESLVGRWPFDENSGSIAADASGGGHDGNILGPTWVQGKYGSALQFDGTDDTVEIPHHADFDLATFTITLWINVQSSTDGAFRTIIGKDVSPAGQPRNFGVYIKDSGVLGVNYTSGGSWSSAEADIVVSDGQWHYIAFTYDGSSLRSFVDGQLSAETASTNVPDNNTEPVRVGRWGGARGDFMNGVVDEVAIYSEALAEDAIQNMMTGPSAVEPSSKLAATWAFLKTQ